MIKYQTSNIKCQISNLKSQISIYVYVHYVGMLFRHRLCRLLRSLRRNAIPTSALPTSPVFSRLAIPALPTASPPLLSPPPLFFSPNCLLFSSPCGEVGWGYPPPLRGGWGVSFPFLVVPPDVIRLSSSCIFFPSLGQPRLPSNLHWTCIVSYRTLYIHSIYSVILKQTIT